MNCSDDPSSSIRQISILTSVHVAAESLYDNLNRYKPKPTEDYEGWVKTRVFCAKQVTDSVTGFVLDNHTPFLQLRGKKRTEAC